MATITATTPDLGIIKGSFTAPIIRKAPNFSPCRIRVDGQFVNLANGKGLWRRIRDCKCAIRNHFDCSTSVMVKACGTGMGYKFYRDAVNFIMANWVGVGDKYPIEIVPVDSAEE
jgi:hypothetical protein